MEDNSSIIATLNKIPVSTIIEYLKNRGQLIESPIVIKPIIGSHLKFEQISCCEDVRKIDGIEQPFGCEILSSATICADQEFDTIFLSKSHNNF